MGILGGTGPAGRGVAVRLAESGLAVTIGSRDAERAASVAGEVVGRWPALSLDVTGADNAAAAGADMIVVATPWDSALSTVRSLRQSLAGKVVVCMANALVKDGREMLALLPPRGSVAAGVQAALPGSMWPPRSTTFRRRKWRTSTRGWKPTCWCVRTTRKRNQ